MCAIQVEIILNLPNLNQFMYFTGPHRASLKKKKVEKD